MNGTSRILVVATLALILAGCAPTPETVEIPPGDPAASPSAEAPPAAEVPPPASVIPSSCDLPELVELIDGLGFPGAIDVTPLWDPADGTDLKLALDNGGLACAWGVPETDGGVVVYWVPVTDALWIEASELWTSDGMESIDVPDLAEDAAFFTYLPQSETNEFPRWELNVRFTDLWIQVATSSWVNPSDGNAVVESAREIATP